MRNSAGVFLSGYSAEAKRRTSMIYAKSALTVEQQADQLIARGLVAERSELIARLKVVNYYRLSGYLYPFRVRGADAKPTDTFAPGTTLDMIWRRYNFDRRLRILLLDAIERIEVAVRTRLVYHFVLAHGPFGHLAASNLPGFKQLPFMNGVRCFMLQDSRNSTQKRCQASSSLTSPSRPASAMATAIFSAWTSRSR